MATAARPTAITIIAILAAIGGVFGVLGGLALLGLGSFAGMGVPIAGLSPSVWGIIFVVLGAAELYAAYGAWNLKGWAWTWLIVLAAIGVVFSLTPRINIVGIVINAVVIYFLFTPQVKTAFGRS